MTALKDLLNTEQVAALMKVTEAALAPLDNPALVTAMLDALDEITTINGVAYDLRSDAMVETTCADCPEVLLVEVAPKGVDLDLLTSQDRTAVCVPCGTKRVAGKRGTLIHTKENQLPTLPLPTTDFDLDKLSDAEFIEAALEARNRMRAEKAEALPEKRKKAKKEKAEREAKDEVLKVEARDARKGRVLHALVVDVKGKAKEIPALDLSEVTDLNEAVTPKMRSPYNKVLYAMGRELLSKETTTYATLADLHCELQGAYTQPAEAEPVAEPKKKGKKKAERLAAQIDPDDKAKVEAFAKVTGKSYDDAAAHLVKVGVL